MNAKYTPMNKLLLFCLILITFTSCQKKKFAWQAGISAPKFYPAAAPQVSFYYQGGALAGASVGLSIHPGWGAESGGFVSGKRLKNIPDSVSVKWIDGVSNLQYEGGYTLPYDSILKIFRKKVKSDNELPKGIVAGMAPGGWVCVFLIGLEDKGSIEIARFQLKGYENPNIDENFTNKKAKGWEEFTEYWKHHGVPYHAWAKPQKEYFVRINMYDPNKKRINYNLHYYTLDGTRIDVSKYGDYMTQAGKEHNSDSKYKLPVELSCVWDGENKESYDTKVVLPKSFEKVFATAYTDSITGKTEHYKEIQIRVLPDYQHAALYIVGTNKEKKILKFKATLPKTEFLGSGDYPTEIQYFIP